jgi:hypothetical protein
MKPAFSRMVLPQFVICSLVGITWGQPPRNKPLESQNAQEAILQQKLSGVKFIGYHTELNRDDAESNTPPQLKPEEYSITKVDRLKDDFWQFHARIRYGEHDLTVPLALKVKWAGDTPVITVEQVLVPGLGTFSARVMIYDDQYAGVWSAQDHGGQLFGRIVKQPAADASPSLPH